MCWKGLALGHYWCFSVHAVVTGTGTNSQCHRNLTQSCPSCPDLLQERCISTMLQHRKNDVWGVLEFAAKFSLTRLQASCLATMQHTSRGHLVAAAESVVQVGWRLLMGWRMTHMWNGRALQSQKLVPGC